MHIVNRSVAISSSFRVPFLLAVSAFIVVTAAIFIFTQKYAEFQNRQTVAPTQLTPPSQQQLMTATQVQEPVPFYELTIPYLRERTYTSQLGPLQKVGQSSVFTSYLTSYNSDGLRINALLTQPTGEMPPDGWPAIVFIHGYIPPPQYRTQEKYVDYVNSLARNGFVVLKIDLRGHGSSEGEASGAYYSSDYVIDTLNAYAALEAAEFVNPSRIGVWGHSMAGNIALRAAVSKKNLPATVIWAGAVYSYQDFMDYGIDDGSYQSPRPDSPRVSYRQRLTETHGAFTAQSEFWQSVAPTSYLSDFTGAIQIHHAVNDNVVSVEYSRNLARLLSEAGIVHELHEYQSGGHNISGSAFSSAMARTIEFFRMGVVE